MLIILNIFTYLTFSVFILAREIVPNNVFSGIWDFFKSKKRFLTAFSQVVLVIQCRNNLSPQIWPINKAGKSYYHHVVKFPVRLSDLVSLPNLMTWFWCYWHQKFLLTVLWLWLVVSIAQCTCNKKHYKKYLGIFSSWNSHRF